MILTKLQFLNFRTIINFLLLFLPISFIAGNLLINLNIILIILTSLIYWKKEFFKIDIKPKMYLQAGLWTPKFFGF